MPFLVSALDGSADWGQYDVKLETLAGGAAGVERVEVQSLTLLIRCLLSELRGGDDCDEEADCGEVIGQLLESLQQGQ